MTAPTTHDPIPAATSQGPAHTATGGGRRKRHWSTRISGLHTGLVVAVLVLVLLVIFVIQNAHTVNISFLGAHLHVSLAAALLIAVIAGGLVVGGAGTARITQLRRNLRRMARRNDGGF